MYASSLWLFLLFIKAFNSSQNHNNHDSPHHVNHVSHHGVSNHTIAGDVQRSGCAHSTKYESTGIVVFDMCVGQNQQDLKNGMSIINLINSRGYLPTCRVLQLLLWMSAEMQDNKILPRESFIDIGANIGSCTVSMASLGLPVVSVEPVQEHVDTIRGTMALNPAFNIDLNHAGICVAERKIKANFGHGARNWGATYVDEVDINATTFHTELKMKTTDQVVGGRKIALMKIDCEGCEWAALKSARRSLRKVPILKIELVQPEYIAGNETVKALQILEFLETSGFNVFMDPWAENRFYFGQHGNELIDTDKMFGSKKFKILLPNITLLDSFANRILNSPIDISKFNHKHFLSVATDVIAIEKSLSEKMKLRWLPWKQV